MPILLAYIIIIMIWSTTPLAIQWSTEVGFLFGVSSRMIVGTLICMLILKLKKQQLIWTKHSIIVYLCAAIGIYGSMLFVYWGALYVPSGIIAVVFGLAPILTMILAKLLLDEPAIKYQQLGGMILALIGLYITAQTSLSEHKYFALGLGLLLISVSFHSLSAVLIKKYNRGYGALVTATGGLLISSTLLTLSWFVFDGKFPQQIPLHTLWSITYLGIIATGIGFVLYYYILSKISPVRLALLTLITPMTAIVIGIIFNGEKLTYQITIGTLFIMTGLILNLVKRRKISVTKNVLPVSPLEDYKVTESNAKNIA
ncbi:Permease of the drug/metabolite transporter (DMT) superfamily [hydrothermal vent metagenome]|uniref:Permease of the drug/metabolite transporter (DMT) superfamily n=1 Tax=hydrothermal vent metagenome TaxID=652676 RepID=A0A3B0YRY6_9ZZZZ